MDLFDLVAKITLDSSEYEEGIDSASEKTSRFGEKLKSGFATAGKVAAAGLAVTGTAAGALAKSSVDAYADYEQLVGGVETLFGESAGKVQEYAENAYTTAGLSANEYMNTVTSFSASLLQSLGGDTQAAAQYADMAITDMSDNANKMGTDMASIQVAYQGFAKQNYTMLDNLKLGYGGTKTEMERLVQDAEKLNGSFKAARNENGELAMSYADIVDAIHIVQDNMGITGTTSLEASKTISGSVGSMKSAWKNLVTGFTRSDSNIGTLITNMVSTASTALDNIIPAVVRALGGIGEALQIVVPVLEEQLPAIVEQVLPPLLQAAAMLMQAIAAALPSLVQAIIVVLPQVIQSIVDATIMLLPIIIDLGLNLLMALADGIIQALPVLLPAIVDVILSIADKLTAPDTIATLLKAVFDIVTALVGGIIDSIPRIISAVGKAIANILSFMWDSLAVPVTSGFSSIFTDAWNAVKNAFSSVGTFFAGVWKSIQNTFAHVTDWFKNTFSKAWQAVKDVFSTGGRIFQGITEGISSVFRSVVNHIIDGINTVVAIPFNAINGFLNTLRNLSILGVHPFGWIGNIGVPQIPKLAKGGIVDRATILEAGEAGDEAIIPLDKLWAEMKAMIKDTGNKVVVNINVDSMNVRDDSDIEKIAKKLQGMIAKSSRGVGLGGIYA